MIFGRDMRISSKRVKEHNFVEVQTVLWGDRVQSYFCRLRLFGSHKHVFTRPGWKPVHILVTLADLDLHCNMKKNKTKG